MRYSLFEKHELVRQCITAADEKRVGIDIPVNISLTFSIISHIGPSVNFQKVTLKVHFWQSAFVPDSETKGVSQERQQPPVPEATVLASPLPARATLIFSIHFLR